MAAVSAMELALREAGLSVERLEDGRRLVIKDAKPEGVAIRNRGGEALARLLQKDRDVRALDITGSSISDNGISAICLALRETNQLEELYLSPTGHCGLEFVLGVVRRCGRLGSLHITVSDVPTMHDNRQNAKADDYDTSAYVREKRDDEEEEEAPADDDDDENAKPKETKLDRLRKLIADTAVDSDAEGGTEDPETPEGLARAAAPASPALLRLLKTFVAEVSKKENLLEVECIGESVPDDLRLELQVAVDEHRAARDKRAGSKQNIRSAHAALTQQMAELDADGGPAAPGGQAGVGEILAGAEGGGGGTTRVDIRSYVNRRLFSAIGEALFECQRFKAKENEAVSTPQGEMAFIAMYLRKHAERQEKGKTASGDQASAK